VDTVIVELADDPLRGRRLRGRLRRLRSLRVGVYRVPYHFESRSKSVFVETIRHRVEAYRDAR